MNYGCQNGGKCTAVLNDPACTCAPGFHGEFCEFPSDPCYNFTCLNGGRCVTFSGVPKCYCQFGFIGDKCETKKVFPKRACPFPDPDLDYMCGDILCYKDYDCPEEQICCSCGSARFCS